MVLARVGFFEPGSGSCAGALVCANVIERTSHHRLVAGRHLHFVSDLVVHEASEQGAEATGHEAAVVCDERVGEDLPSDHRTVDPELSERVGGSHRVRFGAVRDEHEDPRPIDARHPDSRLVELLYRDVTSRAREVGDDGETEVALELGQLHAWAFDPFTCPL